MSSFFEWWAKWYWLFEIAGGVFILAIVKGYLPYKPSSEDAKIWAKWRARNSIAMTALSVVLVAFGLAHLIGILRTK